MCVLSGSSPASRRPFWALRHSRTSGGESSPQVVKADMFFGPHPFQQLLVYPNNAIWTVYPAYHILPSLVRENQYDILKNELELCNFTGSSPNTVPQDLWAGIHLVNIAAVAKVEENQAVQAARAGPEDKYTAKLILLN